MTDEQRSELLRLMKECDQAFAEAAQKVALECDDTTIAEMDAVLEELRNSMKRAKERIQKGST
jgi:hypothetical protein